MLFSSLREIFKDGYTDIPDSFSIENYTFQYESPIITAEYIVSESGLSSIAVYIMSENLTIKVKDGDTYKTVVNVKSPIKMTGCYRASDLISFFVKTVLLGQNIKKYPRSCISSEYVDVKLKNVRIDVKYIDDFIESMSNFSEISYKETEEGYTQLLSGNTDFRIRLGEQTNCSLISPDGAYLVSDSLVLVAFSGEFFIGRTYNKKTGQSNPLLTSFSLHAKAEDDFKANYISTFFDEIDSIQGEGEEVDFSICLSAKSWIEKDKLRWVTDEGDLGVKNAELIIKNSKMYLNKFPADLKPEPIRNFNVKLNIKENIGSIDLTGTVTNPKVKLKYQDAPNLQVGGSIDFSNILEPKFNLIVNGSNIYFALLENTNLNGIADLLVTITGQNVLDLKGTVNVKKSNGFLTPLKDSEFELKHNLFEKENG
jgi:hypothetical protein|tara:strand:- start:3954 stop:5231 length:1278 start_codon:yes stop_codon:yes gene_type:complete